jgi:hypothetical protein
METRIRIKSTLLRYDRRCTVGALREVLVQCIVIFAVLIIFIQLVQLAPKLAICLIVKHREVECAESFEA